MNNARLHSLLAGLRAKARVLFSRERSLLFKQIDRNLAHRNLDNALIHAHRMLDSRLPSFVPKNARVLSVGTCNGLEIDIFKQAGYQDIVGIDLVAPPGGGRDIVVMDMHRMTFADNSFDLLYCSGTFHCTHDPIALTREFVRVVKNGGILAITVPVDFAPSAVYRTDVNSLAGLYELFGSTLERVLWSETVAPLSEYNPNANTVIRSIFTIKKL